MSLKLGTTPIADIFDSTQLATRANIDLSNLSSTGEAKFQAPLTSGTNIKTINSTSLLGSGNIAVGTVTSVNNVSPTNGNVAITIPTKISDLTDDTATYPIDKADYATSAGTLGSSDVGSATQPIYLDDGTATACTYSLNKTVPSDAVFTDTTYSVFTGATSGAAGTSGLVPAPSSGETSKYLKSDGTWGTVSATQVIWRTYS